MIIQPISTMRHAVVGCLVLFLFGLGTTCADKDDSYYVAGTGNPNIYETMYWKDAENVLQDLSKFSALYVKFHHCAWTWNQKDLDEDEEVEENDYWYMGKIPPMGANVAFSLYGQLKSKGGSFRGCDQYSFINSFYTRKGFTAFTTAMQLAGVSGFSSYSSSSFTADCQGGYGIGCDSSGGFATHSYSSSECDPQTVTGTKNQQSNLNKAMQSVQCVKIYDTYRSSSYSSSSNDDSNGGSYDGSPLALLDYSNACFYQNKFSPDGQCPDPYGKISTYQSNFYKDIQKAKSQRPVTVYRQKLEYEETINSGKSKGEIGLLLLAVSFLVLVLDKVVFDVVAPIFSSRRASQRLSNYTDEEDPVETLQSAQSDTDVKSEADTSDDRRYM